MEGERELGDPCGVWILGSRTFGSCLSKGTTESFDGFSPVLQVMEDLCNVLLAER